MNKNREYMRLLLLLEDFRVLPLPKGGDSVAPNGAIFLVIGSSRRASQQCVIPIINSAKPTK